MRYSINSNTSQISLAQGYDINASYKDLTAVCDAVRYLKTDRALQVLDDIIELKMPILFHKYNKYMGARHELGGRKGAYPIKAAKETKTVLMNAIANSKNKGLSEDALYIVHASANKTHIERRRPSKGSLSWGRGKYGMSAGTHSDMEYAKIEIGLAEGSEPTLTRNMKYFIKTRNPVKEIKSKAPQKQKEKAKEAAKQEAKAKK